MHTKTNTISQCQKFREVSEGKLLRKLYQAKKTEEILKTEKSIANMKNLIENYIDSGVLREQAQNGYNSSLYNFKEQNITESIEPYVYKDVKIIPGLRGYVHFEW